MASIDREGKQRKNQDTEGKRDQLSLVPVASLVGFIYLSKLKKGFLLCI